MKTFYAIALMVIALGLGIVSISNLTQEVKDQKQKVIETEFMYKARLARASFEHEQKVEHLEAKLKIERLTDVKDVEINSTIGIHTLSF